jgi:type IV pilus assembly protein PilO
MKLHFSKRDKLIIGVGALLVILLIVYAQFFLLSPLKSELATNQQTLQSEQKLMEIASQKKQNNTSTITAEDSRDLQKKIPVEPLEDQLILDLEKAETISNSQIKSMGFSKDADASTGSNQPTATTTNGQQNTTANQGTANQSSTNQGTASQGTGNQNSTTPQAPAASVPGMKKLTVNLSVESPSYEDFEKFISTLESLNRVVVVESINYTGGQEITTLTDNKQPLSYSLTISAFYMPTLADLQAQLPKIDTPAPAGKQNPLSQFSDTTTP